MRKSGTTFLLVEDDANDVLIVQQEFKRASKNSRMSVVSDGIEAKRYLEGKDEYRDRLKYPLPQVILLDLKMPRFSGFDFLEWLRAKSPDQLHFIPVVVLSSSALPQDIVRAYALGVSSYMTKPVNWEEFKRRLHSLVTYWAENVETPEFPITASAARSVPAASEAYRLAQTTFL